MSNNTAMSLKDLKSTVDRLYEIASKRGYPDEIPVVIPLATPTIGAREVTNVISVNSGTDFESNQINISSYVPLVPKGRTKDDIITPHEKLYIYATQKKTVYSCKCCDSKVSKNDNYCRSCGQRLK